MKSVQLMQVAGALIVVLTPWVVVRVAREVASRHARSVNAPFEPSRTTLLALVTALAAPVTGILALWLPAPSPWMFLVDGLAFASLAAIAYHDLSQLERASRPARDVSASRRTATLAPRRVSHDLGWAWRLLPGGVTIGGLAALAWRLSEPLAHRRLLVPIASALAATVFVWLYETWIHQIATGPVVADTAGLDSRRRQLVRAVFGVELTLVATFVAAAHALLDLDWNTHNTLAQALSLAAGLIGVVGCALAVSSDLVRRRYLPVN